MDKHVSAGAVFDNVVRKIGSPAVSFRFVVSSRHENPGFQQIHFRHQIADMTYADYQVLTESTKMDSTLELEIEAANTKHRITVSQKVDHKYVLLIVKEQKKQVLMLRVSLFGPVVDEKNRIPKGDPPLSKAMAFLTPIVEKFAAGEIDRSLMIKYRDDAMVAQGITSSSNSKSAPRKRPAAASEPAEAEPTSRTAKGRSPAPTASKAATAPQMAASRTTHSSSSAGPPVMDTYDAMLEFLTK